jgi:glycosyltransferase involved in cell wall biosynthesis
MRIGVYARGLSEKTGGVKEYIESLIRGMIRNLSNKNELFVIHNLDRKVFEDKRNVHEVLLNSKSKIICDFFIAPKEINKLNLDVILFPKGTIPFFVKTSRKMLTVHDLAYFLPEYNAYKFLDNVYMKFMMRSSCKRADKIIAISENTKKDIVEIIGIPKNKIEVIYEAADSRFRVLSDKKALEKVRKKFNLNKKFVFYSGSISPRKNIKLLISSFNGLSGEDFDLVVTGNKLWNNEEEMKMIKDNPKIKQLGLVSDSELIALYNLAEVYVYPSMYEGFGLPILEAQACGCPVICSNTSSLPEVGGNSVVYVDPLNEKKLTETMRKIMGDDRLRKDIVRKGFENLKRFSWDKTAQETLNLCSGEK